ncbi:hypothetical protein BJX68DRAFT_255215 [Aspergillus pseudodeflectus]|uniref:NACHT domain-containing protein n=1 Tax=Aspergillus pseudodeflectus TaxID=176178 RepID=A0ABR4KE35_9EURO
MDRFQRKLRRLAGREKAGERSKTKTTQLEPPTGGKAGKSDAALSTQSTATQQDEPRDLWVEAYQQLSPREQDILLQDESTSPAYKRGDVQNQAQIIRVLERVIELTEERSDGREISVRDASVRILSAVLSYRDTVSAATAFDPTGLAIKVWRVVSQGLSMVKNYYDLNLELFESAEFLADILARYALIEKQVPEYSPNTRNRVESTIIRVYRAILQYTAEARSAQESFSAARISSIATPSMEHQLRVLRETIEREERSFDRWDQLEQRLGHRAEAEDLVRRLDDMIAPLNAIQKDHVLSRLPRAKYAAFDSESSNPTMDDEEVGCLPGTRKILLKKIMDWGLSADTKQSIFWLNGAAGTGKSTIARTVARGFKDRKMLGASFFFKRGEADRSNAKKLLTTIVHQLMYHLPGIIPQVKEEIEKEADIPTNLPDQFNRLFLEPLKTLASSSYKPIVIVIDALDECAGQNDVHRLISLLPQVQTIKTVRVKIFLTSRPEHPIQPGFRSITTGVHDEFVLHDIEPNVVQEDILIYLEHRFSTIRNDHSLPSDWPGDQHLKTLATIACPLFISAATFCRFIGSMQFDAEERLVEFLQDQTKYSSKMGRTYLPILDRLLGEADPSESARILQEFQDIVGVIILLETPLSLKSLSTFIGKRENTIKARLNWLHSVLNVPTDSTIPIRPLHLSFRDFLVDSSHIEKHRYWLDEAERHDKIAAHCIRLMGCLKRNICDLPDYAIQRADIETSAICDHLSPELQYSSRFWVHHLVQSKRPAMRQKEVVSFLSEHFLHWLEALSLLGSIADAVGMLGALESYYQGEPESDDSKFLWETKRFILKNLQMIDYAPLQMYCSGLLFAPTESIIRKTFVKEIPTWISSVQDTVQYWSPEIQTLEGHPQRIKSMVFSSDGELLASACCEQILVWKAKTGALQYRLEAQEGIVHSDFVYDVAFSPHGKSLLSCSKDSTMGLWDTQTANLIHSFHGHTDRVLSAAFSPDGSLIVSGSSDNTVRLWDSRTGSLIHTLKGHSDEVLDVVFFPTGILVASASSDKTVKIWDAERGILKYSLRGHSGRIPKLAISPSGEQLLSAPWDGSAKLWDSRTGRLQATLQGHTGLIGRVGFSPNGRLVATGSMDRTVKLWDSIHGLEVDQFARTLRFSKDGQYLCTNFASFDITPLHKGPFYPNLNIAVHGRWITRGPRRMIWLPPEYRPGGLLTGELGFAVHGNMIILGSKTGRVCLLRFNDSVD